ncbi:MAG: hypothetical protein PVI97_12100, partial [Candidatus Thiodiazotropha sp.]
NQIHYRANADKPIYPAPLKSVCNSVFVYGSIANPHLNDDPGTTIAFPDQTCGLNQMTRTRIIKLSF